MINLVTKMPKSTRRNFEEAVIWASMFLKEKYGVDIENDAPYNILTVKYSKTARFAKFTHTNKPTRGWTYISHVRITGRTEWLTYQKKTVGLYSDGMRIGEMLGFAIELIHEFTHVIQFVERRQASEVETTRNEIEFIRQVDPFYYNKLKRVV